MAQRRHTVCVRKNAEQSEAFARNQGQEAGIVAVRTYNGDDAVVDVVPGPHGGGLFPSLCIAYTTRTARHGHVLLPVRGPADVAACITSRRFRCVVHGTRHHSAPLVAERVLLECHLLAAHVPCLLGQDLPQDVLQSLEEASREHASGHSASRGGGRGRGRHQLLYVSWREHGVQQRDVLPGRHSAGGAVHGTAHVAGSVRQSDALHPHRAPHSPGGFGEDEFDCVLALQN